MASFLKHSIPLNLTIVQPDDALLSITPDAVPGLIHDGRGGLYDGSEGLLFVIAAYRRRYLQWQRGKGMVKDWGNDAAILDLIGYQTGQYEYELSDGRKIVPTAEYLGLMLADGRGLCYDRVIVQMAGATFENCARPLNSKTQIAININGELRVAPLFYRSYRLTTRSQYGSGVFDWISAGGPFLISSNLESVEYEGVPVDWRNAGVLENGEHLYLAARELRKAAMENWEETAQAEK
jgi:hypothetical protein